MIDALVTKVKNTKDCIVLPPEKFPNLLNKYHKLPPDLERFYKLCGGLTLYTKSDYTITIVPPNDFALANPVIVGDLCETDISSNWYIVGTGGSSEFITIDLSSDKNGRCYDSFVDRHGVVGDNPIIAKSFSDLLIRLMDNRGQYWYWLEDDFVSLGDAYGSK
ncbi:SMI1/KNR4 family protein [Paenibacillus sp. J5C_2022]|uniref:SMI1/KNR4 family protein n=1 Tax=Paenibacillus sp. J5C2022 TaxID=2977129 RepID=UPI0021D1CCFC|nr:SMI1/KNR4 family protein [Paenibacillus sp. J5C2022]MCU6711218.1 SMI1/KNR4 family protein [Paenibacillus sp. J5C2022]